MNTESDCVLAIYDCLSVRAAKLFLGLVFVMDRQTITQEEKMNLQEWVDEEREYYKEINSKMHDLVNFKDIVVTNELLKTMENLVHFISENVRMIEKIKKIPVILATNDELDIPITTDA
jgi:hypothetical protein